MKRNEFLILSAASSLLVPDILSGKTTMSSGASLTENTLPFFVRTAEQSLSINPIPWISVWYAATIDNIYRQRVSIGPSPCMPASKHKNRKEAY